MNGNSQWNVAHGEWPIGDGEQGIDQEPYGLCPTGHAPQTSIGYLLLAIFLA